MEPQRVAKFEQVSFVQFDKDWTGCFGGNEAYSRNIYSGLRLPARATAGSAGYDFFAPESFKLMPGGSIKIPTGIRVRIEEGWMLGLYPRSSLGFRYRLQMDNTVGIIDSDYYNADNEGHIIIQVTNASYESGIFDSRILTVEAGDAIAQGIFMPYGITLDDAAEGMRHGGFGSTNTER